MERRWAENMTEKTHNKRKVIVMDFSGIYKEESFDVAEQTVEVLDCSDIKGTDGFCDEEAEEKLRTLLKAYDATGVHFIDNGNYHYLTTLWTEKIEEDFNLIIYDHHMDLRRPQFDRMLSCGSWIRKEMVFNPHVRGIIVIGPSEEQKAGINPELMSLGEEYLPKEMRQNISDRKAAALKNGIPQDPLMKVGLYCFTDEDVQSGRARSHISSILRMMHLPIYISVDKDVLNQKELNTNWDQGTMSEAEFFKEIQHLVNAPDLKIIGMDICGEPPFKGIDTSHEDEIDIRASDEFNQKLIDLYYETQS